MNQVTATLQNDAALVPSQAKRHARLGRFIGIIVPIAALVGLGMAALQVDSHPRTDDASVRAISSR